jgi:hypothetical protein
VYRVKFLIIKPNRCTNFANLFLKWKSTCFGQFLCPSSRVFHCTHSNGMSYRFVDSLWAGANAPAHKLSTNLYDIYHWSVYSEKLVMMNRETVRKMWGFIPRRNLRN